MDIREVFHKHPKWVILFIQFQEFEPDLDIQYLKKTFDRFQQYRLALKDTVNIKSVKRSFEDSYKANLSTTISINEWFEDFVEARILLHQQEQYVKSIHSNKYSDLFSDRVIQLIKEIFTNEKMRYSFKQTIINKIARFPKEHYFFDAIENFIHNSQDWTFEGVSTKIKTENLNAEIYKVNDKKFYVDVKDYNASKALGSTSWCISYSEEMFDSYVTNKNKRQLFIYDNSKDFTDPLKLVGVTTNYNNNDGILGFDYSDSELPRSFLISLDYIKPLNDEEIIKKIKKIEYFDSQIEVLVDNFNSNSELLTSFFNEITIFFNKAKLLEKEDLLSEALRIGVSRNNTFAIDHIINHVKNKKLNLDILNNLPLHSGNNYNQRKPLKKEIAISLNSIINHEETTYDMAELSFLDFYSPYNSAFFNEFFKIEHNKKHLVKIINSKRFESIAKQSIYKTRYDNLSYEIKTFICDNLPDKNMAFGLFKDEKFLFNYFESNNIVPKTSAVYEFYENLIKLSDFKVHFSLFELQLKETKDLILSKEAIKRTLLSKLSKNQLSKIKNSLLDEELKKEFLEDHPRFAYSVSIHKKEKQKYQNYINNVFYLFEHKELIDNNFIMKLACDKEFNLESFVTNTLKNPLNEEQIQSLFKNTICSNSTVNAFYLLSISEDPKKIIKNFMNSVKNNTNYKSQYSINTLIILSNKKEHFSRKDFNDIASFVINFIDYNNPDHKHEAKFFYKKYNDYLTPEIKKNLEENTKTPEKIKEYCEADANLDLSRF